MIPLHETLALLDFPKSVREAILSQEEFCKSHVDTALIFRLTQKETWIHAQEELEEQLSEDEHGLQMLCCMMMSLSYTYDQYQRLGISDELFVDTMNCFPRFVREYETMHHTIGFDRSFWTGRQLSLQLFRIKELEFELCKKKTPYLSIHIPSDADLSQDRCINSILQAKNFFQTYHLCETDTPMMCESWLLSPALKELLSPNSNILKFQALFELIEWNQDAQDFMMWVYHCEQADVKDLKEDTSLQRHMRQYILHGGKIGNAKGYLKEHLKDI